MDRAYGSALIALSGDGRTAGSAFDLAAFPKIVRVYGDQAATTDEIQRAARSAAELDVLAVRGLGLLALRNSLLRQHLRRDGDPAPRLRVLLPPDSEAAERRAAEIGESPESLASGILLAVVGQVEVCRYSAVPARRISGLDSTLYVGFSTPIGKGMGP